MAESPVEWVKAHPKATAAVVGVAGLGAFAYWLLTRNSSSSSATSGLTPQQYVLAPTTGATTTTGGQSGGSSGYQPVPSSGGGGGGPRITPCLACGQMIKGTCANGGILAALCPKTTVPPVADYVPAADLNGTPTQNYTFMQENMGFNPNSGGGLLVGTGITASDFGFQSAAQQQAYIQSAFGGNVAAYDAWAAKNPPA